MRLGLCVACKHCERIDIFQNIKCTVFSKTNPAIFCRYFLPVTSEIEQTSSSSTLEDELKKEILKRLEKLTKARNEQSQESEKQ